MPRWVLPAILICAIVLNFVGIFAPEMGFDALWYHLTIPKIYLAWGRIDYIPGGLLYYSAMPKLGELMYLVFGANDTWAHFINWSFGVGTAIIIYKYTKNWLASVIFYVTPIVSWLSGSAYIDLIRTFFEFLAFYLITKKRIFLGAVAISLAIGTKTLSLGSIPILMIILFFQTKKIKHLIFFSLYILIFSSGWFIWSFLKTGYPFYPIGAGILDATHNIGQLANFWKTFIYGPDFISPIYIIFIPLLMLNFKKLDKNLLIYFILSAVVWVITPNTGGGRFILPYLPVWAILVSQAIHQQKLLIFLVIIISVLNIGYRVIAMRKLVPYYLGQQTKTEYLCKNLDFSTGVFVDCENKYKNLTPKDMVLIKGYHNLYYVDFPFVHETWLTTQKYNYVIDKND